MTQSDWMTLLRERDRDAWKELYTIARDIVGRLHLPLWIDGETLAEDAASRFFEVGCPLMNRRSVRGYLRTTAIRLVCRDRHRSERFISLSELLPTTSQSGTNEFPIDAIECLAAACSQLSVPQWTLFRRVYIEGRDRRFLLSEYEITGPQLSRRLYRLRRALSRGFQTTELPSPFHRVANQTNRGLR